MFLIRFTATKRHTAQLGFPSKASCFTFIPKLYLFTLIDVIRSNHGVFKTLFLYLCWISVGPLMIGDLADSSDAFVSVWLYGLWFLPAADSLSTIWSPTVDVYEFVLIELFHNVIVFFFILSLTRWKNNTNSFLLKHLFIPLIIISWIIFRILMPLCLLSFGYGAFGSILLSPGIAWPVIYEIIFIARHWNTI